MAEDDPELRSQQSKWLFTDDELRRSPSVQTGHTVEREGGERGKGCEFIFRVCYKLRIPQQTISTACVFLHRFYMRHALREYHYYEVAATAVFLATKCEETVRKLRDIVIACCQVALKNDKLVVDEQSKEYWRWRDVVLYTEETLLEALCFDLNVLQPYASLKRFWRQFGADPTLARTAWAFANDSFRSSICVQYEARTVAAAALHFASIFHDIPLEAGTPKVNSGAATNVVGNADGGAASTVAANANGNGKSSGAQSKLGDTARRRRREWYEMCEVELREVERVTERMVELYESRGVGTHETAKAGLDHGQLVKAGSEMVRKAKQSSAAPEVAGPIAAAAAAVSDTGTATTSAAGDATAAATGAGAEAAIGSKEPAKVQSEIGDAIASCAANAPAPANGSSTTESPAPDGDSKSEALTTNGVHPREEETGRRASKRLRGNGPAGA